MTIEDVRGSLRTVDTQPADRDASAVKAALTSHKRDAVARGDQEAAKWVWCLEQVLDIQDHYLEAFRLLKLGEFYKAWCALEQAEIRFVWLAPHFTPTDDEYRLRTIERLTAQLQKLFPYRIFASTEIITKTNRCTICGAPVSLRRPCGHRVGEIYDGEMCGREIEVWELAGMSLTDTPANKYAVAFPSGPKGQEDHYDYTMLRSLLAKLEGPFTEWEVEVTTGYVPHERYRQAGRNEPCPCRSGEKYKRCCLPEKGVRVLHYQLWIGAKEPRGPADPALSWLRV